VNATGVILRPLAYERYERQPQVDMGAIVENKRLSHVLQTTLVIQAQRDDRHASNLPHRTNSGQAPYAKITLPGTKRSRQFTVTVTGADRGRDPHSGGSRSSLKNTLRSRSRSLLARSDA